MDVRDRPLGQGRRALRGRVLAGRAAARGREGRLTLTALEAHLARRARGRAPEAAADPATYAPYRPSRGERAREALLRVAGVVRSGDDPVALAARRAEALALAPAIERTLGLLADDASRLLLLDVVARRVLGPARVALPVSRRAWTAACDALAATASGEPVPTPAGPPVRRLSWAGAGGEVRLWGDPVQVVPMTSFGQYGVRPAGGSAEAGAGVLVDAGGGWAESALWLADRWHGAEVVSLELDPANAALWERNRAENPRLASRVALVRAAAWSRSGEEVAYAPAAGASAVGPAGPAQAPTVTIDDAVAGRGRVGLVKLDVEGAELEALRGARATIERDRPALAISVYHRLSDLVELPAWVASLGLGYRMWLGHHTPWLAETVLYARATR